MAAVSRGMEAAYTRNRLQAEYSLVTVNFSVLLKRPHDISPVPHRFAYNWLGLQ